MKRFRIMIQSSDRDDPLAYYTTVNALVENEKVGLGARQQVRLSMDLLRGLSEQDCMVLSKTIERIVQEFISEGVL